MASARGPRSPILAALLMTAALASSGCPVVIPPVETERGPNVRVNGQGEPALAPVPQANFLQTIDGTMIAPAALGNGTRVVGEEDTGGVDIDVGDGTATDTAPATDDADATDAAAATDEADASATYRVLQTTAFELPVEKALVSVKSYQFKIIDQFLTKPTDEEGKFFFAKVPAKNAFFLDASFVIGGKKHQMYGITRTGELGQRTSVTVDVASTLTARLLMRIWQQGNYFFDFRDLSPKDFNPLLLNLRNILRGGLPAGVSLDLTKVSAPVEPWDNNAVPLVDADDSAIVALDRIAAQYTQIDRDIDRIYRAANLLFVGKETGAVVRPPKIR